MDHSTGDDFKKQPPPHQSVGHLGSHKYTPPPIHHSGGQTAKGVLNDQHFAEWSPLWAIGALL